MSGNDTGFRRGGGDFTAARKKGPVHISICAGLSIVVTTATL